jgi:predicted metal-dependent hydrolase
MFDYVIRISKRTRNLRATVKHDGSVIVTKPRLMPDILVRRFVAAHAKWIEEKLENFKKKPAPLLGKLSRREYVAHKEAARVLAHDRIAHFNAYYTFPIASVRIGNQKSRWGSCSTKRNLNFNYKIVLLPKELSDYVIVHELCHLRQMNHSEKFWSLVEEQIPNWKTLRKELKKY